MTPAPVIQSRALRAIALRERTERLLAPYLEEFLQAVPDLRVVRRTYGGAWVVGLRTHRGPGDLGYSRLEFELEVDAARETLRVTVKSTTFNRDHPVQRLDVAGDEDGFARLEAFFERAFLLFAGRYWESESSARWTFDRPARRRG